MIRFYVKYKKFYHYRFSDLPKYRLYEEFNQYAFGKSDTNFNAEHIEGIRSSIKNRKDKIEEFKLIISDYLKALPDAVLELETLKKALYSNFQ